MCVNDQNMSALIMAAETSNSNIVEYLIALPTCSRLQKIEALELLGASYANDKHSYNSEMAYGHMMAAMQERFCDPKDMLWKQLESPIEAYNYYVECRTIAELEQIKDNVDLIHMESLVIRERILGENNPEIPHPIVYRGAVFADNAQFDQCTALWMRAMHLRFSNNKSIANDLTRFAQVFAQMIYVGVQVDTAVLLEVLRFLVDELGRDNLRLEVKCDEILNLARMDINIHTCLYLLVLSFKGSRTESETLELRRLVYRFVRLDPRLSLCNSTPLHMACNEKTQVDEFHVRDVVAFPSAPLVRLLLFCGADADALDIAGNSPLHVIATFSEPIRHFLILHCILMDLIRYPAHIDICNSSRQTPMEASTTGVAELILRTQSSLSLKCICAHFIRNQGISYSGQIPTSLEHFVGLH